MSNPTVKSIPLADLWLNLNNPRYEPQPSFRDAITVLAHDQGWKLVNLAADLVERGLNPSELPIVTPDRKRGAYTVLEGNRRIAALHLLGSHQLLTSIGLPPRIQKRFSELAAEAGKDLPDKVLCAVMPPEEAKHWIHLKHTGENDGVGTVRWDGPATHRFRGSSAAYQAIRMAEQSGLLDEATIKKLATMAITNVERMIHTPDARKELGIHVSGAEVTLDSNRPDALFRLAELVSDIANQRKKVTDLKDKAQRVNYAQQLAARPIPAAAVPATPPSPPPAGSSKPKSTPKSVSPVRTALIPNSFKIPIQQARINKIYHELQRLSADAFPNSAAVLLRVFLELGVDHYCKLKGIPVKVPPPAPKPCGSCGAAPHGPTPSQPKDLSLREKIRACYEYLEDNQIRSKHENKGIRTIHANRDHVLSVDSLNAYVHNKDYTPTPEELKTTWDNIQPFIEALWTT